MILRSLLSILFAGAAAVAIAQDNDPPSAFGLTPDAVSDYEPPAEEAAPRLELGTIEAYVQSMPLRKRVAHLMLVTMEGQRAPSVADLAYLKRYTPAGAIVDLAMHPESAQTYVVKLKGVEQISGLPLWVGADIYRLTRGERTFSSAFIQIPSLMSVAASGEEETQARLGRLIAEHLKVMGFNLHLGPALSLAPVISNAAPSIGHFGSDPKFAADSGAAVLGALLDSGIDAVPMGFPGGAFNRESRSPAVLLTPEPQLMTTDLVPFRRAIEEGAPIIHVGNTLTPTLDESGRPASLSDKVMKNILRDQLGYEGVVMAGPLDAPEVVGDYDPVDSAVLALRNGADLLYFQSRTTLVMRVVDRLTSAVEQGLLPEATVNAALGRILKAKLKVDTASRPVPDAGDSKKLEFRRDLKEEVTEIERRSITLLQNNGNLLPLEKADGPIAVTGVVYLEDFANDMEDYVKRVSQLTITTAKHSGRIEDYEIDRMMRHSRGIRTMVVVVTDKTEHRGTQALIRAFHGKGTKVVLVLLGHPEKAKYYREAEAILLAYCHPRAYDISLSVMAEVMMGEGPVSVMQGDSDFRVKVGEERQYSLWDVVRVPAGRLPVHIDDLYRAGRAVSYNPVDSISRAEWDFGTGKTVRQNEATYAFSEPGRYPVTLTVRDVHKRETAGTFHMIVEPE